ncbi:type II secretion system protein GspM [Limnohabitans sp.]|uniref:type II secretion system protein GspM n=1 Tax=Limnohabitans sp. TaxID=1907725 RepID=UPI0038B973BE
MSTPRTSGHSARDALRARWQALSSSEQRSLSWLGGVLCVALVYSVAIAPAWRTLKHSQAQREQLGLQLAQMQALQAQAQALQQRTPMSRDEALRTLQSLSNAAGSGLQLTVQGERVSVQVKALPASALAQWLQMVRTQAQSLPVEAHLSQASSANPGAPVSWNGTLVLSLPQRPSPASKAP